MSAIGIRKFAKLLSDAQQLRQELLSHIGPSPGKLSIDHQDAALSGLCRDINDAVKHQFMKITLMDPKTGEPH